MQRPSLTTTPPDRRDHAVLERGDIRSDGAEAIAASLVHEKLGDALTPGFQAEFDPGEADIAGAFYEDALSELDALESMHDAAPSPASPVAASLHADRGSART